MLFKLFIFVYSKLLYYMDGPDSGNITFDIQPVCETGEVNCLSDISDCICLCGENQYLDYPSDINSASSEGENDLVCLDCPIGEIRSRGDDPYLEGQTPTECSPGCFIGGCSYPICGINFNIDSCSPENVINGWYLPNGSSIPEECNHQEGCQTPENSNDLCNTNFPTVLCSVPEENYHINELTPGIVEKNVCTTPEHDINKYIITENNIEAANFNVTIECGEGYMGNPSSGKCSEHDTDYSIVDECIEMPMNCSADFSYQNEECLIEDSSGSLSPCSEETCGQEGVLIQEYSIIQEALWGGEQCLFENHNIGDLQYEPCVCSQCLYNCSLPSDYPDETNYNISGSLYIPTWGASIACEDNYHSNNIQIDHCLEDNSPVIITGECEDSICTIPQDLGEGVIIDNIYDLRISSFDVDLECDPENYNGSVDGVPCSENGENFSVFNNCVQNYCTLPNNIDEGTIVTINNHLINNLDVDISCDSGYYGSPEFSGCLLDNSPIIINESCSPIQCSFPELNPGNNINNVMNLSNSSAPQIIQNPGPFPEICQEHYNGSPTIEACTENGGEMIVNDQCQPNQCTSPTIIPEGYTVIINDPSGPTFDVSVSCITGYEGTPSAFPCPGNNESFLLSSDSCTEYICSNPEIPESVILLDTISPSDLSYNTFNVSMGCDQGYSGIVETSVCSENGGEYSIEINCSEIPYCEWNLNPCENQGNCMSTSRTEFTCECPSGYSGDVCQEEIPYCDWNPNPCENQGNCISKSRTVFTCDCRLGWGGDTCTSNILPSSLFQTTYLSDILQGTQGSSPPISPLLADLLGQLPSSAQEGGQGMSGLGSFTSLDLQVIGPPTLQAPPSLPPLR